MNCISVKEMSGWRAPVSREQMLVEQYVVARERAYSRTNMFWEGFVTLVWVCILLNILCIHPKGWFLLLIFEIPLTAGVILLWKSNKSQRVLVKKLRSGDYRVLPCTAYEGSVNITHYNVAAVKVYVNEEQCSIEDIGVDKPLARTVIQKGETGVLVVWCDSLLRAIPVHS